MVVIPLFKEDTTESATLGLDSKCVLLVHDTATFSSTAMADDRLLSDLPSPLDWPIVLNRLSTPNTTKRLKATYDIDCA